MKAQQIGAKQRGRPSERGEAKRAAIAVRTTPTIKDQLARSAEAKGRSITQEVEARVEQSFELDELMGSSSTKALMIELARQISRAEAATGKDWFDDPTTHRAAMLLIEHALRSARPVPQNYAQAQQLQVEHAMAAKRWATLTVFLRDCGVLRDSRKSLAIMADPDSKPLWEVEGEGSWHRPEAESGGLSDEDREFLRSALIEWSGLEAVMNQILDEIRNLLGPNLEAVTRGERIAEMLLKDADQWPSASNA
jgi:hypothetical protein